MSHLRNKFHVLALVVLVAGLGCTKPQTVYQRVEVPVPVPCPAPPPRRPLHLPIQDLPADATPEMKRRALLATLHYLLGRYDEAEALLDGYRPQPSTPEKP